MNFVVINQNSSLCMKNHATLNDEGKTAQTKTSVLGILPSFLLKFD